MRVVRVGADDPRAAEYANLTDVGWRQQMEPAGGLFLAEGEKVISRAVVAGCVPRSALLTERWLPGLRPILEPFDIDVMVADEATLRKVVGFRLHRGALAAFSRPPRPSGRMLPGGGVIAAPPSPAVPSPDRPAPAGTSRG